MKIANTTVRIGRFRSLGKHVDAVARASVAVLMTFCAGMSSFGEDMPAWKVEGLLPQFQEKAPEYDSAARWVWSSKTPYAGEVCSLRCAFDVDGKVDKVVFYGCADDSATYWVNGVSVPRNDGGKAKSAIVNGQNVFAIVASNAVSRAGALLRCEIKLTNGRSVVIHTDAASFKVADGIPADGWKKPGYDDASWRPATELGDVWLEPFVRNYASSVENCTTAEERAVREAKIAAAAAARAQWEKQLDAEPAPDAKIVYSNGMPKISLNGNIMDPVFNQSGADNPFRLNAVVKMASLGVKIHQLTFRPSEYETSAGSYSFDRLDEKVRVLLEAEQDARFLLLVRMEFPKWIAAHKQERIEYANGETLGSGEGDDLYDRVLRPSPASPAYRAEVKRFLGLLGDYVGTQPWRNRLVAIRPSWGVYTEWHMYGMDEGPDIGPVMTAAFHRWKDGMYDGQPLPSMNERTDSKDPFFVNTDSHRKLIDFYACMANEISDLLTNTAHAAKAAFPGRLVGMYYGYVMATHSPEGANVMLDKVLSCPDVDFLSNPADYASAVRLAGGAYYHRTIPATFHRYGKLAMLEDDMRHYHVYEHMKLQGICTRSAREEEMTTRRNWLNQYFDGCGIQFLDPEGDADIRPFLMDTLPVWQAIDDSRRVIAAIGGRAEDSGNEIAVVVDWRGRLRRSSKLIGMFERVYKDSMTGLYASGIPFDLMTLDDFLATSAKRYRKAVFLNVVAPDAEMKSALQSRVAASGFKSIWLVHCPFSLDGSSAKVYEGLDKSKLPHDGEGWRDALVASLQATPLAPVGHCVRRHGDIVMFHTGSAVKFDLDIPGCVGVTEMYSGTHYARGTISIETTGPDTLCFKLERMSGRDRGSVFLVH